MANQILWSSNIQCVNIRFKYDLSYTSPEELCISLLQRRWCAMPSVHMTRAAKSACTAPCAIVQNLSTGRASAAINHRHGWCRRPQIARPGRTAKHNKICRWRSLLYCRCDNMINKIGGCATNVYLSIYSVILIYVYAHVLQHSGVARGAMAPSIPEKICWWGTEDQ